MWCGAMTPEVNAPIALMLGGYAVETLLKMVIVGDYCDANGLTYDALRTKDFLPTIYDLRELAKKAALRISKADRELLAKLSKYTVWAGRYPIPMKSDGYEGPAIFDWIESGKRLKENPIWSRYVPLYEKLHRLAVRKTLWGQHAPSRTRSETRSCKMNLKKGLLRLWLVVSASWMFGWFFFVLRSCVTLVPVDNDGPSLKACRTELFKDWITVTGFGFREFLRVVEWAFSVPIALLIIGLAAWWVASGFRTHSNLN